MTLPALALVGSYCEYIFDPISCCPGPCANACHAPVSYKLLSTVTPPAPNLLLPLLGIFPNPGSVPNQLIFAAPAGGFSSTLGKAAIGNGTQMRA